MAVYYVSAVTPVAYPAFFNLSDGTLPETFFEWRMLEDVARRELVAEGHHVIGIPVAPADFRDYCRSMNCRPDGVALNGLATRIGADIYERGERYERARARTVIVEDVRARPALAARGRTVLVDEAPVRRHWWQFWRRPVVVEDRSEVVVADAAPVRRRHWWQFWRRPVVVEERPGLAFAETTPVRRHWWQFWRRPVSERVVETTRVVERTRVERTRPFTARTVS